MNAFVSTITVWYIWIMSFAALSLVCLYNCRSLGWKRNVELQLPPCLPRRLRQTWFASHVWKTS